MVRKWLLLGQCMTVKSLELMTAFNRDLPPILSRLR